MALAGQAPDSLVVARRVVAATSLAAKEYALGVIPAGGRITLPEEVDEARLFIDQARLEVPALPRAVRAAADSELAVIRAMLDRLAPPAQVERRAAGLVRRIAAAAGGGAPSIPCPHGPPRSRAARPCTGSSAPPATGTTAAATGPRRGRSKARPRPTSPIQR